MAENKPTFVDEEEESPDLSNPQVVDKYKAAADVANRVMQEVIQACQPGKKIADICMFGDKRLEEYTSQIFSKVKRGIAFPTCISVNNCCGHFSPFPQDPTTLKEGDVVKVDLGAHIDGFISVCAHTFICGQTPEKVVTGRTADVICAAYFASECALKLMRPGKTNKDVTDVIQRVANVFKCKPLEGVLSHQMKRFVIDGNQVIINRPEFDQQVEEFTFQLNEVYALDVVMSTGEGHAKEMDTKCTVFKRQIDQSYGLKMKSSRALYSEIVRRFGTLPFSLTAFEEKKARAGITELVKHDLVQSFPVLYEKPGEIVAQFKFTVLLLPSGTIKLNAFALPYVQSQYSIQEDPQLVNVWGLSLKRHKKKKKPASTEKPQSQQQQAQAQPQPQPQQQQPQQQQQQKSTTDKMDTS